MSYPQLYKDELLKAIESIDLEKVGQAIAILARARDEAPHSLLVLSDSRGEPCKVPAAPRRSTERPDRKAGLTCVPSRHSPSLHENGVAPRGRRRSRIALAASLPPRPGPRNSPEIHPLLGHLFPLRTNRVSWPVFFLGQRPDLRRERRWRFRRHRRNTDSALGPRPAGRFASTLFPGWHIQRVQHLGPGPQVGCHPRRKRAGRCASQVDRRSRSYDALDKRSLLLETYPTDF